MRLMNTLNGYVCDAELRDAESGAYGSPRILIDVSTGAVIDRLAFRTAAEVLEASEAERRALHLGGFLDVSA